MRLTREIAVSPRGGDGDGVGIEIRRLRAGQDAQAIMHVRAISTYWTFADYKYYDKGSGQRSTTPEYSPRSSAAGRRDGDRRINITPSVVLSSPRRRTRGTVRPQLGTGEG
ncbi:hypothetical protein V496_08075 [Pseudogymnoascus sp. VKM F-4515 (FW-2607)]|nr:hypothetical protein V496_08075 [Pseudogymnoascus sp. VKM F-4515 (FW-2607)]